MRIVLHAIAMMALLTVGRVDAVVYCDSSSNISSYEWIDAVAVNGVPYISGNNGGYVLHPPQPIDTQQITLELTPGFGSATYPENWGVWIDWNQDGSFDPSEQVYTGSSTATETLTTSIPVPLSAMPGETRMRVVMTYGSMAQACGVYTYGETEDFPIYLSGTSPPPPPSGYCDSSSNVSSYEWIDAVAVNWVPYISGNNGGYILHPPQPIDTQQITLELTPGFGSATYPENWGVWIDWNQDGSFDPSEQVYTGSSTATETLTTSVPVPLSAMPGETRMRVVMTYGSMAQACGIYTYGETEDFPIYLSGTSPPPPPPVPVLPYTLSVDSDYTVYRNGPLDASLIWVVEKDGVIVLQKNAKYDMEDRYYSLTPGSKIRVWLNNTGGEQVSNTIEYTVDQTYKYFLNVDTWYGLNRSGTLGENLTWVIEKDGMVVLERNAANEQFYTYFDNTPGSHFRVSLKQPINGQYQRVSNYVEYIVGNNLPYEISIDQSHRVMRTGNIGEPVMWRIERDGILYGYADATSQLQWVDYENLTGTTYSIVLVKADGFDTIVSNSIQFTVDDILATHSLTFAGGVLARSGNLGEGLTWVIERDGRIVLQRNASNELQYAPTIYAGSQYRFWLTQFINGGYQRVSNIVTY